LMDLVVPVSSKHNLPVLGLQKNTSDMGLLALTNSKPLKVKNFWVELHRILNGPRHESTVHILHVTVMRKKMAVEAYWFGGFCFIDAREFNTGIWWSVGDKYHHKP